MENENNCTSLSSFGKLSNYHRNIIFVNSLNYYIYTFKNHSDFIKNAKFKNKISKEYEYLTDEDY